MADAVQAVVEGFLAEHDRDPERMRWLPRLIEREQRKALDAAVQRVEALAHEPDDAWARIVVNQYRKKAVAAIKEGQT